MALERTREFAARTPDFDETLRQATANGHTLADATRDHFLKKDRGDVAYYVAKSRQLSDRLHNLTGKPQRQIEEADRIIAKFDRERPFVTEADNVSDVDRQLRKRDEDFRTGKRRRR